MLDRAESLVFDVAQRRVVDSMTPLQELLGREPRPPRAPLRPGRVDHRAGHRLRRPRRAAGRAAAVQPGRGRAPGRPWARPPSPSGMVAHAGIKLNKPVLLFSLEMSHLELTQRLLVLGGPGRRQPDAHRQAARGRLDQDRQRHQPDERGAHLHRRQPEPHGDGHPGPGPAAQEPGGPGPGGRRLPPADDRSARGGEPPGRGVRDQPRAQDPGPRARGPGGGAVPAVPGPGDAPGQAPDAGRPAGSRAPSSRTPTW